MRKALKSCNADLCQKVRFLSREILNYIFLVLASDPQDSTESQKM